MTKEQICKRIENLKTNMEEALANAQALSGAIQDCEYWLAQLTQVEVKNDDLALGDN